MVNLSNLYARGRTTFIVLEKEKKRLRISDLILQVEYEAAERVTCFLPFHTLPIQGKVSFFPEEFCGFP